MYRTSIFALTLSIALALPMAACGGGGGGGDGQGNGRGSTVPIPQLIDPVPLRNVVQFGDEFQIERNVGSAQQIEDLIWQVLTAKTQWVAPGSTNLYQFYNRAGDGAAAYTYQGFGGDTSGHVVWGQAGLYKAADGSGPYPAVLVKLDNTESPRLLGIVSQDLIGISIEDIAAIVTYAGQ